MPTELPTNSPALTEEQAVFLLAAHLWMQAHNAQHFHYRQIVRLLDLALGTAARLDGVNVMQTSKTLPKPNLTREASKQFESAPVRHWQAVHMAKLDEDYLRKQAHNAYQLTEAGQRAVNAMLAGQWLADCFALAARPWLLVHGDAVVTRLREYIQPHNTTAEVRMRNMRWVWDPLLPTAASL